MGKVSIFVTYDYLLYPHLTTKCTHLSIAILHLISASDYPLLHLLIYFPSSSAIYYWYSTTLNLLSTAEALILHYIICYTADTPLHHLLSTADAPLLHLLSTADTPLDHILSTADTALLHLISTADTPLLSPLSFIYRWIHNLNVYSIILYRW